MAGLALILSSIALVFAYLAYRNTGGSTDEMKTKIEDLGITTENFREKTADALVRIEKLIRGEGPKEEEKEPVQEEKAEEETTPQA